jgi:hypothetical protein
MYAAPHCLRERAVVVGIVGGLVEKHIEPDNSGARRLKALHELGVPQARLHSVPAPCRIEGLLIERDDNDAWIETPAVRQTEPEILRGGLVAAQGRDELKRRERRDGRDEGGKQSALRPTSCL